MFTVDVKQQYKQQELNGKEKRYHILWYKRILSGISDEDNKSQLDLPNKDITKEARPIDIDLTSLGTILFKKDKTNWILNIYSRTSVARTLMARLPRLLRTRSSVADQKKSHSCRHYCILNNFGWFSFCIDYSMLCVLIRIAMRRF